MKTQKKKKSNRDIGAFFAMAEAYLRMPGQNLLAYAVKRTKALLQKAQDLMQEQLEEVSINLASVDEKGNLITNNGQYVYTPAKRLELGKSQKAIMEKVVEIEVYIAKQESIPKDLQYDFIKAFTDFVIEEPEEKEEATAAPTTADAPKSEQPAGEMPVAGSISSTAEMRD